MLEMLGYTVLVAQTPGEAMHKATNHPERIDLLLSDVIMPEMSGLDLAQRMQLIRPGLKCLFMSGYTADILDRQTGGDEPVDLIEKPFMLQDLAAKVRAVLARM
jgi:CheY-like chemotaxis protein